MMSLTLYRMIVSVTVLCTLMVVALFVTGVQHEDPVVVVTALPALAVMTAWSAVLTAQKKERIRLDEPALSWAAVVGIQLLATGILFVLMRALFG